MRLPSPSLTLEPGEIVEVPDAAGQHIIAVLGRYGVVGIGVASTPAEAAKGRVKPNETVEQATRRAQLRRLDHLQGIINNFKEVNSQIRAAGGQIMMPTRRHRECLEELGELRKLVGDLDLMAQIDALPGRGVKDHHAALMEPFGLDAETASMTPGVEASLTDIEGV